jgi:uncharacterized DUF497 family protein
MASISIQPRGFFSIPCTLAVRIGVAGEEGWQTIGMVNGALLILVAHTVVDEEAEVLRIVSARRVTHQERIEYEEASQI